MKTTNPSAPALRRYESIDIAKAFAIILVVIGHFSNPHLPHAYDVAVDVIYMFHMPLFMFASGFLCQATWRPTPYRQFLAKKFKRLMIPYFAVSVLIIGLKMVSESQLTVDNPVSPMSFLEMFWSPAAGYFLWFIWALWWMMVIIPLFSTSQRRLLLFAASFILYFVSPVLPEIFCLRQFGGMLVFFSGGTVLSDYMRRRGLGSFPLLWQVLSVIGFVAMAWVVLEMSDSGVGPVSEAILTLTVNILGIAMSMTLARWWRLGMRGELLRMSYSVAAASYVIYLLHTTFEGLAKGVLGKVGWFNMMPELPMAWFGAAIVVSAGVCIPWWLASCVFGRWRITSLLFGVPMKKK